MHSKIRKVPMYLVDRNDAGKMIFLYQGSGMQLGTEGFAVGFLYMVVGLLLAFMTHVFVCVKNRGAQRLLMAFGLIVSLGTRYFGIPRGLHGIAINLIICM
ncbi:putative dolichyl-diphosphooligosaccharide--protein glycosyltransferase subunit 3b [Nicotiana attenuata]|uniref:Dolichyl-diphosphooligosaccharide--protein glycosyltransferase subunit 3b n=1 Tax=Nicotiana attenuata TaxID=49451 RepID=A0A314KSF8_NICAT|nr:putative dolichyl-diphosphooligosaccharide--protein glycosyltransferase subunit 3b [Nicotiana attenuata]